ncbi:unnamed protein product [Scytosiphon promiscuus]
MAHFPRHALPRGKKNKLHDAVLDGSVKRTVRLLSEGSFDIDEVDAGGCSPLMAAASVGHARVMRILLSKGAAVSLAGRDGATALHVSAQFGHLEATTALVEAGARLEARNSDEATPLHLAAHQGHPEVLRALVAAGACINTRLAAGETPLYSAAYEGHADAVAELLLAGADTRLQTTNPAGKSLGAFAVAAGRGHWRVVLEFTRRLGIEACGAAAGGVDALHQAAQKQRLDILEMLADAGAVDTGGKALAVACELGREESVKFLLRQKRTAGGKARYVRGARDPYGRTPLICTIDVAARQLSSPRIARLLIDAGADTESAVRVVDMTGMVVFDDTPLAITTGMLRYKIVEGEPATAAQLNKLKATRRLLLSVEAVRAASWLWVRTDPAPAGSPVAAGSVRKTKRSSTTGTTSLTTMLPLLRKRTRKRGVLLSALLSRYASTKS